MSADGPTTKSGTPHPPDPRMAWLREITEPTEEEVGRVLSGRVTLADASRIEALAADTEPSWVEAQRLQNRTRAAAPSQVDPRAASWARATAPHPPEVDALISGRMPEGWQAATEPTDHEVQRLLARRAELVERAEPRRYGGLLGLGGAAAAGLVGAAAVVMALFLGWGSPSDYGQPDLAVGRTASLASEHRIELGPSIDLQAHVLPSIAEPTIHLVQADARGTVVDVIEGGTRFEVDPEGSHRDLVVRARDVSVVVKGTVFTVDTLPDRVEVGVERGRVEVNLPDQPPLYLTAGQVWRSDTGRIASAFAALPSPPEVEPQPEPELQPQPQPIAAPEVVDAPVTEPAPVAEPPVVSPAPIAEAPVPATEPPAPVMSMDWPPRGEAAVAAPQASVPKPGAPAPAADPETGSSLQAALAALSDIRARHEGGEDPVGLIRELERELERGVLRDHVDDGRSGVAKVALDIRLDLGRAAENPAYFDDAVRAYAKARPADARVGVLRLEAGHRYLNGDRIADAIRVFDFVSTSDGDLGVRALVGLAQANFAAGEDARARVAMQEAMRRVSDPGLEDEIEAMMRQMGIRR